MFERIDKSTVWPLQIAGIFLLLIAMGVGRFAYTSFLPLMQEAYNFGDDIGGWLASINFLGYLLGAFVAGFIPQKYQLLIFRIFLYVLMLSTILMGLSSEIISWSIWRFAAGLATSMLFVLGSDLLLHQFANRRQSKKAGYIFSGVGIGIALTGVTVPVLDFFIGVDATWIVLGLLTLPQIFWIWYFVLPEDRLTSVANGKRSNETATTESKSRKKRILIKNKNLFAQILFLNFAYLLEGGGYAVYATFLVRIIKLRDFPPFFGDFAWIIVGIFAALSTIFLPMLAIRTGARAALLLAYLVQAVGMYLPLVSNSTFSIIASSIFFGSTFMGIVSVTITFGRSLQLHATGRIIGILTTMFALGQIITPYIAGLLAEKSGNFLASLYLSLILVLGSMAAMSVVLILYRVSNKQLALEE